MKANLEDLIHEYWIRRRNKDEITWTTRSGEEISIKKMSDVHLINAIKMLENNNKILDYIEDSLSIH